MDLGNYRKNYKKGKLSKKEVPRHPIDLFSKWFSEAKKMNSLSEVNAMNFCTIGLDGYPKSRIVLLKQFSFDGFIFYTHYKSEKGMSIVKNENVCASFFWEEDERQVIIKGKAKKIPSDLSDSYFESRPEISKLVAWASDQSKVIENRSYLKNRLEYFTSQFRGGKIFRPEHWGGYLISPISIEFWQGRENRMHDRINYILLKNSEWKIERLSS